MPEEDPRIPRNTRPGSPLPPFASPRSLPLLCWVVCASAILACSAEPKTALAPKPARAGAAEDPGERQAASIELTGFEWAAQTMTPEPGDAPDPDLSDLMTGCGQGDMALHVVAEEFARHGFAEPSTPDLDLLAFLLRKRGTAVVMPEVWVAEISAGMKESELREPFRAWTRAGKARGEFWCGAGRAELGELSRIVILRADVLAYVLPIPTRISDAERPEVRLRFVPEVDHAELVLLSPEGRARHAPLAVRDGAASGKLPLLSRGPWTLQVMAKTQGGPRPVAGALVSVDQDPPREPKDAKVPGEEELDPTLAPDDAVFALLNGARVGLGLSPLKRSKKLDRIAAAHSERMLAEGRIGHTSGDGTPDERVRGAGIVPNAVGENVALAPTPRRLHRALWASPSHRENLLLTRWDEVGIAIAEREDGALFLTQLFIDKR